jgi:hypothetical protein
MLGRVITAMKPNGHRIKVKIAQQLRAQTPLNRPATG